MTRYDHCQTCGDDGDRVKLKDWNTLRPIIGQSPQRERLTLCFSCALDFQRLDRLGEEL